MPRKKKLSSAKLKLTPKQLEQAAAIAEIEAILAMEAPEIRIKKSEIRNKKSEPGKQKSEVRSQKSEIENNVIKECNREDSKLSLKKIKFLSVRRQEARSPYLVNLKKIWENKQELETKEMKNNLKKVPEFIKKLPARHKEVIQTISRYSRGTVAPWSIFWQGLTSTKSTGSAVVAYAVSFYRKHQRILDELLFVNILLFLGIIFWQAIKFLYAGTAWFARLAMKELKITTNAVKNFWPVKSLIKIMAVAAALAQACFFLGAKAWQIPLAVKRAALAIWHSLASVNRQATTSLRAAIKLSKDKAAKLKWPQEKLSVRAKHYFEQQFTKWRALKFLPPLAWQRQLIIFVVVAIMLIVPFKVLNSLNIMDGARGRVLGESEEAANSFQQAVQASGQLNFSVAASNFSSAADSFRIAQTELARYSNLIQLANILPGKRAKLIAAGGDLITSGQTAARAGEYLARGLESLELGSVKPTAPVTARIRLFASYSRKALVEVNNFEQELARIDTEALTSLDMAGKTDILRQISKFKGQITLLKNGLGELVSLSEILPEFLGEKMDKRYLLVFQNNAEMRASGGFIGSFALVDLRRGEIKKIEVPAGGSYDLQGGLHKRVTAPQPLHLINSLWEFQDANWWPDWPTSAEKIAWFFTNGWGSTVDGVIALDPTFLESILKAVGPIDLTKEYGAVVSADNFYEVVQAQAERKDTNKSKKIISDLINKILVVLPNRLTSDAFFALLQTAGQALAEKHLLLQFSQKELEQFIRVRGWGGEIKKTAGDYLAVINTNIAGGKSDRKIKQAINHQAEVMADGSIIDTVTITREHTARKGEPFAGVRNVNYLRVYVPQGSELMDASGFSAPDEIYFDKAAPGAELDPDVYVVENIAQVDAKTGVKIYSEFNKTVFAHWTQVDPGQTITVTLKYQLPFKLNNKNETVSAVSAVFSRESQAYPYSLLVQKQAGSITTDFTSVLTLAKPQRIVWTTPNITSVQSNGWQVKNDLREDNFWGILVQR